MRFVIVTGMSGAGKSSVLKMLEDAGYFCVDNLPVPLVLKFAEISWHEENMMSKVALGIDIRSRNHLNMLEDVLKSVRDEGYDYEILFMDCKDDKLIKRYKETRRNHPLYCRGKEPACGGHRLYRRQASIGDNNQCFVRENERSGIQYQSRTQGCRQRWTA